METRPMEEVEFVDVHRASLIQKVNMVMAVADELLSQGMLHREDYAEMRAASTTMQAMRELDRVLHSGGHAVKRAFYAALHKHEPHLLQSLRDEVPSKHQKLSDSTCSLLSDYKDWVKSEFEYIQEYNSLLGQEVPLSERYVELLIVQEHRKRPEREEAICATGVQFQQVRGKRDPTSVEKLFCPDKRSSTPKIVFLQGDSGHGKSFTAQKIVHDWASGTLYADLFHLVLLLRCKDLNELTEMKSFMELLNTSKKFQPLVQEMLETAPHKVLVLIEGFDELRLSEKDTCSSPSDVVTPAPVEAIILGLFKGHLLSDSSLLITARPSAHNRLVKLVKRRHQRFAEILGFTQESVEKYFRKFFNDDQSFVKAFQCVQKNEVLLTSCFVPIICWTVCTILQEKSDEGADIMADLETTSSIYLEFLSTMLEHHYNGKAQETTSLVRSLGQLAESGMLGKQILFDEQSVSKVERDPASNPFLCKILFPRRTNFETFFSFMHLSFQEFFTAVHYALNYETDAQEKVKDLLLKIQPGNPLPRHTYLWPVVQFLFGIGKTAPHTHTDGPIVAMPPVLLEELKSWIKRYPLNQPLNDCLFLLHCLCELHEEAFVQSAIEAWGEIHLSHQPLKRSDWWVLRYCLLSRPSIRKLMVLHCNLTGESLKLLLPALAALPCQELRLHVKTLLDGDIGDIVSTLGKKTGLRSLTLDVDDITNRDGRNLCLDLKFMKTPKVFRFHVRHSLPTEPVEFTKPMELTDPTDPVLSGVYLVLPLEGTLAQDWTALLHPLLLLTDLTEGSPGVDEHLSAVIGFLCSVPALQEAELQLSCLTRDWAARIRPLIEACPQIKFIVRVVRLQRYSDGLLLEEGIRALQELHKPPGSSLTVTGRRCNKLTGHCTDPKDMERVCNRRVRLIFKDQCPPEQTSLQASIFQVTQ